MKWADPKHAMPLHNKLSSLGNWLLPCYHCLADARHLTEPGKVKQFQLHKISKISQALLIFCFQCVSTIHICLFSQCIVYQKQAMLGIQEPSLKFYARHAGKWEEIIFLYHKKLAYTSGVLSGLTSSLIRTLPVVSSSTFRPWQGW